MTAQERIESQSSETYVKQTEIRASLAFHRISHDEARDWWTVGTQQFIVYPSNPSDQELREATQKPSARFDATPGEMAAADYAANVITAHANLAMFELKGRELEEFLSECIRVHAEKACKLLRPTSTDEASNQRIYRIVDIYTTNSLSSIRMISHAQALAASGVDWHDVLDMLPGPPSEIDNVEVPTDIDNSQAEHDFSTESGRKNAVASYCEYWTARDGKCSEAALARAAQVDPSDLVKWKAGDLPDSSVKKERIEGALRKNIEPILLPPPD